MANPSEMGPLMFALLRACASWDEEGVAAIMASLDGIADREAMILCLAAWANEVGVGQYGGVEAWDRQLEVFLRSGPVDSGP